MKYAVHKNLSKLPPFFQHLPQLHRKRYPFGEVMTNPGSAPGPRGLAPVAPGPLGTCPLGSLLNPGGCRLRLGVHSNLMYLERLTWRFLFLSFLFTYENSSVRYLLP